MEELRELVSDIYWIARDDSRPKTGKQEEILKLIKARDSKRDAELLNEPSTDWYKEQLRLSIKKFDDATSEMQQATESMKRAATLTNKDGDDKGE